MEVQYQRFNSNQGGNCPVTPLPLHLPLPQSLYGRTLGRTLVRSRDYQIFSPSWVYQNFLPMVLRWRASRAGAPLLNIAYKKEVVVRYTGNAWKTFREEPAEHLSTSRDGTMDTFFFRIPQPSICQETSKLEFAIRYSVKENVYWDDNLKKNYSVFVSVMK